MGEKAFREYLSGQGFKFTKERKLILREIFSLHNHFDPEQLFIRMKKKGLKVSKASIYRTLPLLLQSGLIEQVERTEKHAHYEHTLGRGHHDHMLCISCGSAIEFFSEELERLQDEICKNKDFDSVTHTLEIKGYCSKCRKKRK